ncbi:DUF2486 family protein [Burkholderia gladioli]|uniref:DUF2486 domain-containing protein n=1 Tax=Burkholderia gladioli TaxID=28095 RepID=A0A2A7S188_BURGA|nr:DUF2486 family protein [Burkholderia gladioli]ATF86626.1 hypothetical protein CO712_17330 [Burkholderia gladioli pv. gladioli]MBJ9660543.1 DUF2486 family protein [Burkholderia gladioli]MBU9154384.1 DUF2486 family protein [Burkholderia gladioli]MBU9217593.1 DUF2486 family protein [Burkholderia gladioli]MBU9426613.1 DUF2486 family protein [Burkholderia gladioli]
MPDAHNEFDIPVLTDVLVPGKSVLARRPWQAADAAPPHATDLPELPPQVPPELAASGLPTLGGGAGLSTAYGAPAGAGADALPASHLAPGEPAALAPRGLVSSPATAQGAEAPAEPVFVAAEPVTVPPEFAGEPQPLLEAHEASVASEPDPAEAAFVAPESSIPQEFSASPAPLVEPQAAPLESTRAEAVFVAAEPAVPQEFAAAPQPLPVEAVPAEMEARPDPRDDEHDAPDNAPLAYALDGASQEPAAASATPHGEALHRAPVPPDDLAARTESALHRVETLAPAAFAQLSPVAAETPVPARFADVEALPPAELIGAAQAEPGPPPAAPIDSRHIAERLQGRVADYLSGEGRALIDARCREAVQQHAAWLVGEVSQQVVTALAPEFERWVAEAVDEALARRDAPQSRQQR